MLITYIYILFLQSSNFQMRSLLKHEKYQDDVPIRFMNVLECVRLTPFKCLVELKYLQSLSTFFLSWPYF